MNFLKNLITYVKKEHESRDHEVMENINRFKPHKHQHLIHI